MSQSDTHGGVFAAVLIRGGRSCLVSMGARKKLSLGGLLRKSSRGAKALPASTTKKKGGLFGGKSKKTTDPTGIDVGVG